MKNSDTHFSLVSLEELPQFAKEFSQHLKPEDVISLSGDLGSGKTTFLYSLLTVFGMTADQDFSSPTFAILNQYHLKKRLVNHMDLFRLNHYSEFRNLGLMDCFHVPEALTFVEWGGKFSELESYFTKKIHFEYSEKPEVRKITVTTLCKDK